MLCGKEGTGEIIATSANQIVLLKLQKCCTIFTRPPFPIGGLKGGLGTRLGAGVPKAHLFVAVFSQLTADCLCTVQMAGVETVWELHTLIETNSW